MKKKRITYGVYGMMEYQSIIKIGRATLKVLFIDGSMTAIGQNPAKYTTSDFLVQHAIENSSDFKRGRITVVNTIELDEEVRIERNPVKPSIQQAAVAKKAVAEDKPNEASLSVSKPVVKDDVMGAADEPTDDANADEVEEKETDASADTEETSDEATEEEATEEEATDDVAEESATAEGKTEVEFTDNQEAKDYLLKNFGIKPGSMRNRDDIKAAGLTYGVTITFANENKEK
jgi:hypothetical protein